MRADLFPAVEGKGRRPEFAFLPTGETAAYFVDRMHVSDLLGP
jgi:hypothetical protein